MEFSVADVGEAVNCAPTFKAKVDDWLNHPQHPTPEREISLEGIKRKLERACEVRKAKQQYAATHRSRAKRLRDGAATSPSSEKTHVGARAARRSAVPDPDLETRLADAADARQSRLRSIADDAHSRVQHAKQVADTLRNSEAELAASRRRLSDMRHAAAAARRDTRLRALAAVHGGRSPECFLRANAAFVERHRQLCALRRIQNAWRAHSDKAPATAALAHAFVATTVPGAFQPSLSMPEAAPAAPADDSPEAGNNHVIGAFGSGAGMPWQRDFDTMSALMQSPHTISKTRLLLVRFEALLRSHLTRKDIPDCSALLRALLPKTAAAGAKIDRYPVKLLLCAYMVQAYPETLLNDSEWDGHMQATGAAMLAAFEALVKRYHAPTPACDTTRDLLKRFDEAWVDFLDIFSTWRGADAAALEADLVRIAVDMQSSMLAAASGAEGNPQVDAIVAQVEHDQALLRTRVSRLRGAAGVQRFNAAIAAAEPSAAARRASVSPSRSASEVQPAPEAPTAPEATAPTANEVLFHQLLLNPAFQFPVATLEARWAALMAAAGERVALPTIEATASPTAIQQHVAMVAQDALVDAALAQLTSITDDASEGAIALAMRAAFGQMLAIISELARDVFEALPEAHGAHAQRAAFEHDALAELLEGAGTLPAAVVAVAGLLDKAVTLLLEVGAPSREPVAREATRRVTAALQAALAPDAAAAPAAAPRAVAAVLTRALRLLLIQMQMLKADSANGRLTLLSATLTPNAAVNHATTTFARRFSLPTEAVQEAALHAALPITAEFAASSPSAEHVTSLVEALRAAAASGAAAVPANLRTGRVSGGGAAPPPPGSLLAEPLLPAGCAVDSWEARFRCAVAALLVQPMDFVDNPGVPEVLRPYCALLDSAKGMYQKSIVTAACLRIAETAAADTTPLSFTAAVALEARLSAIQADSTANLISAAEDVILAAVPNAAGVTDALREALSPSSAALQREAATMLHQLQALLLHGRSEGLSGAPGDYVPAAAPPPWAQALLQTPAALSLHAKIGEVAHQLMRVATVAEAVHQPFLSKLF